MKQLFPFLMAFCLLSGGGVYFEVRADGPQLAHIVFFELKDNSPKARAKLVKACQKYLSGHEGTVYFSAGTLAQDLDREVNVRDFDVALHLIFKDKAAHDKYQEHPRHLRFIKEHKDDWKNVRVFDSYLAPGKRTKTSAIQVPNHRHREISVSPGDRKSGLVQSVNR